MKAITYAPVLINAYLSEKITESLAGEFSEPMKFFPTLPTDINTFAEDFPSVANDVFATYDRMLKMRSIPFPHVKKEQVVYYLYKMNGEPDLLIAAGQIIADLLDRQDESAEELNLWIREKTTDGLVSFGSGKNVRTFKPVHFHELKTWQLEEQRDLKGNYSVRTYMSQKILVDYKYHAKDYS
jgi:hypothetical protein